MKVCNENDKMMAVLLLICICCLVFIACWGMGHSAALKDHCDNWRRLAAEDTVEINRLGEQVQFYQEVKPYNDLEYLIRKLQPRLGPIIVTEIAKAIHKNCEEFNLNELFVLSLISRESKFLPFSKSGKEAYGLMQVRYSVHKAALKKQGIKNNLELYHIHNNVRAGCTILKEYMDRSKTVEEALKRYVGGKHDGYIKDIFAMMVEIQIKGRK